MPLVNKYLIGWRSNRDSETKVGVLGKVKGKRDIDLVTCGMRA